MKRRVLPSVLGVLAAMAPGGLIPAAGAASSASAVAIVHRPIVTTGGVFNDQVKSTNWSGYAVTTSDASYVVGSWVQPTAKCSSRGTTYASFWVGLDGYSSNSVEQLGTDSDCSRGTASYYAWYEMYPANSVSLSKSSFAVSPGDSLTASVSRSGTSYTLSITDNTRHETVQTIATGSDQKSSAEWVAEAPELCSRFTCSLANLTNFGTVSFTGGRATDSTVTGPQPIAAFTAGGGPHEMTMVTNSGATKAQPSLLGTDGESFSVTWKHS